MPTSCLSTADVAASATESINEFVRIPGTSSPLSCSNWNFTMTHVVTNKASPFAGLVRLTSRRIAGALTGLTLGLSALAFTPAIAAPTLVASAAVINPQSLVSEVRHRRSVQRNRRIRRSNNNGEAAILGLFGALIGASVAHRGYDNYSYHSYGPSGYYGYAPYDYRGNGYYNRRFRDDRYPY